MSPLLAILAGLILASVLVLMLAPLAALLERIDQ
jgi:hypothetical protein